MRVAVKALRATFAVIVLASILVGCGGSDEATEERIARERREPQELGRQKERLRQIENRVREGRRGDGAGSPGSPPAPVQPQAPSSGLKSCGDGVSANSNTTCPFALNVKEAYFDSGQSDTIDAYSPQLGRSFTMSCSAGSPHVCTGGANAEVRFP